MTLKTKIAVNSLLVISMALNTSFSSSPQQVQVQTNAPSLVLRWSSGEIDDTRSLAWGDVDGDGDLDLIAGNLDQPNRLYLNHGGMLTSTAAWLSDEADATRGVAWGDFDDDGDLDLAVANKDRNGPNRLYRNDNGTLTTSAVWSSVENDESFSVDWGDYDSDGDLDLAVGNLDQPNRLYLNSGGALTTSAVWSSDEADATHHLAWGDWDGDGDLDLVVANNDQPNRLYLNNNGTLTTSAVWSSTESDSTRSVAWGDYDGDGDLDLAVGNFDQANLLYRNDNGVLTTSAVWSSGEADATDSLSWGDIDADGDLDLAVGNREQPNRLYRNDGGILTTSAVWSSSEADDTRSVAFGDCDGDGALDLATGNARQANRLYHNDDALLKTNPTWSSDEADGTRSLAWGDLDGDGDLDLAAGNWHGPNRLYRNDSGVLMASAVWSSDEADATYGVAWGDYDGDGDLDLVVANNDQPNRLYLNNNGTLTTSAVWSSTESDSTRSVAWGDYDGDGDLDLAVGNWNQPIRLYHNEGGVLTTSAIWSSSEANSATDVAWGDFDNDGDLDLAVGNSDQPNRVYRNDGGTLTATAVWSSMEIDLTQTIAWGDYDSDGDLDLVTGNWDQPDRLYRNDDGTLLMAAIWSSIEADDTRSVIWGDFTGDGKLDLAAGHYGQASRLYRNDVQGLATSVVWSSTYSDNTNSVAWGDVDGDGDLDLVTGNLYQPNRLYHNQRRNMVSLINDPPYVAVSSPSLTNDAAFFFSPDVIQAAYISITFTLFDAEGDVVPRIFPEFSPNGGGQWFPATPGLGGDGLTNLSASREGISHTVVWHAEADLIKSDNVVFRIRAQPNYTHSPILWPAMDSKSLPFRVEAPWYIKVVDDDGEPIAGATIYADGQSITHTISGLSVTNRAGLLNPEPLNVGTTLMALAQRTEAMTRRDGHDGWAYRIFLRTDPFTVIGSGEQRLVVRRDNPLVLFNLVLSVEWDADDVYLAALARAVRAASDYLYDLTDGQMAFGSVAIYDDAEHWADADIQISTKNIVRPHAYIGGILADDTSHVIRAGRYWDGRTGDQGAWDQADGYRTLIHEFGHYALHLYDEYFAYTFDPSGNLTGEVPAYCTGPENRNPATDAVNASAMDYHYTSSELSARDVPGLWSALCEQTAQWQLNGDSPWETLARMYADSEDPPRWQLTTPLDRGSVLSGPTSLPTDILPFPEVTVHNAGASEPPRQLTVYSPQGLYSGAIVALYKTDGRVIGQGFTSSIGRLEVYGASPGDVLRAASMDGGLAGAATVGSQTDLTLTLSPVGGLSLQATQATNIPHMRVIAEPSPSPNQTDLLVSLHNFGPGADPSVVVTQPGSETGYAPTMSYSPSTGTYEGQISFSASQRGMGRIRTVGTVDNRVVRLQSTYRLQRVTNDQGYDVFSDDGNLSLHLEPGGLPGGEAYLVVMPPGALPGPVPAGLAVLGDPYDVTASGALVALEKPAVLKLRYDAALFGASSAPLGLGIYRWDPNTETWQRVPSSRDEDQRALAAPVTTLGTYALLGPPPSAHRIFLPVILHASP